MATIKYRYCWNSANHTYSPTTDSFIPNYTERHPEHIPSMDGYRKGDKLTLAYEGEISDGGLDINREVGKDVCETLFMKFNAPWERPAIYAGPSMSVGDVVTLFLGNGAILDYAVDRVGFVSIDRIEDEKIEQRPKRWLRDEMQIKEYLFQKQDDAGLTDEEEAYLYGEAPNVNAVFLR